MTRSLLRITLALAAAHLTVTLLRRETAVVTEPAPEPFALDLFESVPVDGSVLLRVAATPLEDPRLVLAGPMGDQVLEPLLDAGLRGAAVGFAAGADDVAAAAGFTLRTAHGSFALPAPVMRPLAQALQLARA